MSVQIEIQGSGRHVHLSEPDFHILFGEEAVLACKRQMDAGMFQAVQRVQVAGPKGGFPAVTILGPFRRETQVELSLTDMVAVGIAPALRMSGELDGTPGCILTGPAGRLVLGRGVILAKRHVHFTPEDAGRAGVSDGENVLVLAGSGRRALFDQVKARVDAQNTRSVMHIDFDEMNAAGLSPVDCGTVFPGSCLETLLQACFKSDGTVKQIEGGKRL